MARITENVSVQSVERVDREKGVVYGVKLSGLESVNNRRYTDEALAGGVPRYEGAKFFVDHGEGERTFRDFAGVFENVRNRKGDGNFGDLHLLASHPCRESILECAERYPKSLGMSHVIDADFDYDGDGTMIVNAIESVFSVDLVTDPATTAGFFESRSPDMAADQKKPALKTMSLRKLVESVPSNTKRHKTLREMLEGDEPMAPPEMEVEVEPEASPEDQIKKGLMAAIVAKLDAASDEQLSAVMEALELDDSLTASAGNGGDSGEGSDEPTEESANQKLMAKLARMEAKTMLLESDREATEIRVKAMAAASDEDRKALLESWPVKQPGKNQKESAGRPAGTSPPKFKESGDDGDSDHDPDFMESKLKRAAELKEQRRASRLVAR